ncbi:MAG: hypothetical protein ACOZNI_19525 [Myxococcota bacterium]
MRRAAPALVALALALGAGVPQALNDLRSDDWTLLAWGRASEGLGFVTDPPPFPYLRPLNALAWQLLAGAGVAPWPSELAVFALWGLALVLLYAIAARSAGIWGGAVAVGLAVCTREVREIVNWRSWLTTAGGLAGVLGALWLAGRGRGAGAIVALALGAGFKEVAWWHGGWALAASRRFVLAGVALAAFVVHVRLLAPPLPEDAVGIGFVARNAAALGRTLVGWAWPVGLLLVALGAPREAWKGPSVPLLGASAMACVPALGFYLYNPFYFVEAAILGLLAILPVAAEAWRRRPRWAIAVAIALGIALLRPGQWEDFRDNVPWQQRRMREGRALHEVGRGAAQVWAPAGDPGPCGLAADLLVFEGAERVDVAPADGRKLRECLVVR